MSLKAQSRLTTPPDKPKRFRTSLSSNSFLGKRLAYTPALLLGFLCILATYWWLNTKPPQLISHTLTIYSALPLLLLLPLGVFFITSVLFISKRAAFFCWWITLVTLLFRLWNIEFDVSFIILSLPGCIPLLFALLSRLTKKSHP